MNNAAKLLRVVSRLPAKRQVSTIRPKGDSVVYNGVTYTKMLHPHTLTAQLANWHWKLYWEKFLWFKFIVYATILVAPFAIYTNYNGKSIGRRFDSVCLIDQLYLCGDCKLTLFFSFLALLLLRTTFSICQSVRTSSVFSALYKAKREEKKARKAGVKHH